MLNTLSRSIKMAELELGLRIPLIGGPAIPPCRLRVAERNALANIIKIGQLLLCLRKVLRGGQAVPVRSLGVALLNAFAFAIHQSDVVLRPCKIAVRGSLAPCKGLRKVIRRVVAKAEISLSVGVPLLRGLALPVGSLCVILRQALPRVVHRAQQILRPRMALLSSKPEPRRSLREVACVVVADALLVVRVRGRIGRIAAPPRNDAGARRMQRQRRPRRNMLQTAFGLVIHRWASTCRLTNSRRYLASAICSRSVAANSVSRSRCSHAAACASRCSCAISLESSVCCSASRL